MNLAIIMGRLGKDPETRNLEGGTSVTTFSMVTNETYKDKSGEKKTTATWHSIVAWGKQGEVIAQYVKKGQQLSITGSIDNRSYDDKEGVKRYITEIKLKTFEFISSKGEGGEASAQPAATTASTDVPAATEEDDLPF